MFEITFLGTSASAPSVHRGLSSLYIQHEEFRFLVDCGEGTQRQILRAGIGFKRLNQVLLTHGHLDHILGLGGLVSTFLRWDVIEEMEIYGSRHTLDRVSDLIFGVVLRGLQGSPPVILHEIKPGIFWESEKFTITAFPVEHRGSHSLGYRFEERSRNCTDQYSKNSINDRVHIGTSVLYHKSFKTCSSIIPIRIFTTGICQFDLVKQDL